jgi:dTDP-4-amino-4,6-dideoxygalactose transaminase
MPIYKQPAYKNMGYDISLPNAENASNEVLSLPVHPSLSKEDLKKIAEEVKIFSRTL